MEYAIGFAVKTSPIDRDSLLCRNFVATNESLPVLKSCMIAISSGLAIHGSTAMRGFPPRTPGVILNVFCPADGISIMIKFEVEESLAKILNASR